MLRSYFGPYAIEPLESRCLLYANGLAQPVHEWITNEAFDFFTDQFGQSELSQYIGSVTTDYTNGANNRIIEGAFDEDESGENPWNELTPEGRHFWARDPETYERTFDDGLGPFDSAPNRSIKYFTGGYGLTGVYDTDWDNNGDAQGHGITWQYNNGQKGKAYYWLGHVSHLLQDLSVPAHSHADEHVWPDNDTFHDYVDSNSRWETWAFPAGTNGGPTGEIDFFTSVYALFHDVASRADNFDSDDEDGQIDAGSRSAKGFTATEALAVGNAMMPIAIEATAELFRYFFGQTDPTAPSISVDGLSSDFSNPTPKSAGPFVVSATATDTQSGIDKDAYHFFTQKWLGSSWSPELDWVASTSSDTIGPFSEGVYRVWATAVNSANLMGTSGYRYFSVAATDTTWPSAALAFPANGAAVGQSLINATPKYIDVTFSDTGGSGLNNSSITDSAAEFSLSGAAAAGVTVNGAATLVSGTRYRYTFTGTFGLGAVSLSFPAGTFADLAGNVNAAFAQGFSVVARPVITSITPNVLQPLPLPQTQLLTIDGSGFTPSSTLTFTDTSGILYTQRVPVYVNSTRLQYNIKVGTDQGQWSVKVVNSPTAESDPATFYVSAAAPVATPIISPAGGNYTGSVEVSISTSTPGAMLRYTLDGTDPTTNSPLYSGPFTLSSSATVKARGFKIGIPDSSVASANYVIAAQTQVAAPTFTPNGGTFTNSVQVSISTTTPGAQIIYTTNGHDPTISGVPYTGPFTLTSYATVRAFARKSGLIDSAVRDAAFFVNGPSTPLLSLTATEVSVGNNNALYRIQVKNGGGGVMNWSAWSWAADSWIYCFANGSSSGPNDVGSFWYVVDRNFGTSSRTGHIRVDAGLGTQGSPIDILITQGATPAMDIEAGEIILTTGPLETTPVTTPRVGQEVYVRFNSIWTGITQELGWYFPFPNRSPYFRVLVDGVPLRDSQSGGLVPYNWLHEGLPWTVTPGSHTIDVDLDTTGNLPETNENNNHSRLIFTAAPLPSLSLSNVSFVEGNAGTSDAVFTVTLPSPALQTTTVDFGTVDGTATSGSDYVATSGTVTFEAGQQSRTITVPIMGDSDFETNESFTLELSNPTNATIATGTAACEIVADDLPIGTVAAPDSTFTVTGPAVAPVLSLIGGAIDAGTDWLGAHPPITLRVFAGASARFASRQHLAALELIGGFASIAPGGNNVLTMGALAITEIGVLDVTDNAFIVEYGSASPLGGISALLTSGYNGGLWNGAGIRSTQAAAIPGTAIGYGESFTAFSSFPATFLGETVDSSAVVARFTLAGDANLNRAVNSDDFNILASNFGQSNRTFSQGDFNYDGTVNSDDFNILAGRFGVALSAQLFGRRSITARTDDGVRELLEQLS